MKSILFKESAMGSSSALAIIKSSGIDINGITMIDVRTRTKDLILISQTTALSFTAL